MVVKYPGPNNEKTQYIVISYSVRYDWYGKKCSLLMVRSFEFEYKMKEKLSQKKVSYWITTLNPLAAKC